MPWIGQCLNSCKGYPVIVVDNQSTDGTVSFIEKYYPKVEILCQIKNLGFGAANNIGMKHAIDKGAHYVFLLNQDAYLQPETIHELVKVHREHPAFGILSPIHLNSDGSSLDVNFSNYFKINNHFIYDALIKDVLKPVYEVPFVNAAAWLLPRQTIEVIGGFDFIFYHYGEDDNYCQRVLFHGYKMGVVPHTFIHHDRENRPLKKIMSTEERLVQKERQLKAKWGNINIDIGGAMESQKGTLKTMIIKLFLKFKFNKAVYYRRELSLINRIVPEIYKSRSKNSTKGRHYL